MLERGLPVLVLAWRDTAVAPHLVELNYRAPTVTGRFAKVRAWTESATAHPLYLQRAELSQDGKVTVEAKAKFLARDDG
jgi:hypothetical protein